MKKILLLICFSLIFCLFGCIKKDNAPSSPEVRAELIEKLKKYDEQSLSFKSFKYSIGNSIVVTHLASGRSARESERQEVIIDMENGIFQVDDKFYFQKGNEVYTQYKNDKNLVVTQKVDTNLDELYFQTTYEELFIESGFYTKNNDVYNVSMSLGNLAGCEMYDSFALVLTQLGLISKINDCVINYICAFDDKELSIRLETTVVDGLTAETSTLSYLITILINIEDVNKSSLSLFDSKDEQFALDGDFKSASANLYEMIYVYKRTKQVECSVMDCYETGSNYFPIRICDTGYYEITNSNVKFEIYDINNKKVQNNYFEEGVYFIRIDATDSLVKRTFNITFTEGSKKSE